MSEPIGVLVQRRVGICTIDHAPSRNSLGPDLSEALIEALEGLDGEPDVRCIVLTGTGEFFATGPDLRAFAAREPHPSFDPTMTPFWDRLRRIGTPIVAAVGGWAFATGCELALACDLMVVAKDATFGLPEITFGLIPGGGATQRLSRVLGKQRTMELVLTGRRMSGEQAYSWGLANIQTERRHCLEQAVMLAEQIADRPPLAARLAKRAILAADELGLEDGLASERRLFTEAMATEDRLEGVSALLEGRPPDFSGR